jgi:fatty acid desaturase
MNTTAVSPPRAWFRDRESALANSLVLTWTCSAWLASFALMGARTLPLNIAGCLLCAQAMVLAAYLIHEAAHQNLFTLPGANRIAGELMNFVAGSSYASFERIRHMHIRHHVDRADLTCFDFKGLMQRRPAVRNALQALEWAYVPATEVLMHLQVIARPLLVRSQRRHLPRVLLMLLVRGALLALLALWSLKALLWYALASLLLLHVLNLFDAFHHTFEQYCVAPEQALPMADRDRQYEQDNTYSNLISVRYPLLNLLTLNFGYHNAHHHRPSVPWHRLPALHASLYGTQAPAVLPLAELLRTWHRNRVRRVSSDHYGVPGAGAGVGPRVEDRAGRADAFVGAHGVSFLTVV